MIHGLSHALKGINGQYEVARLIGALGGLAYIVSANAFVAWNMADGRPFDVTAYCLAFPSGLGAVVLAVGGAVAIKDRGVATAQNIRDTTDNGASA